MWCAMWLFDHWMAVEKRQLSTSYFFYSLSWLGMYIKLGKFHNILKILASNLTYFSGKIKFWHDEKGNDPLSLYFRWFLQFSLTPYVPFVDLLAHTFFHFFISQTFLVSPLCVSFYTRFWGKSVEGAVIIIALLTNCVIATWE